MRTVVVRKGRQLAALVLGFAVCQSVVALAQKYKPEDPVPPGASGKILPIQGKVVEIRGVAAAVSGKSEALGAALKDLGAVTSPTEIRIALNSDVLFDFDKATILPKAFPELQKVAIVLKSYPNAACTIEGHTDAVGNDGYNQTLSERRADAVKEWLVANGVTARLTTRGWGRSKPVAPNKRPNGQDDPEGRQKNRRVEIVVKTG